jgi:hypothetical protein
MGSAVTERIFRESRSRFGARPTTPLRADERSDAVPALIEQRRGTASNCNTRRRIARFADQAQLVTGLPEATAS